MDSELQIDIEQFKQDFSEVVEQLLEQIRPILEAIKQAVSITLERLSPRSNIAHISPAVLRLTI